MAAFLYTAQNRLYKMEGCELRETYQVSHKRMVGAGLGWGDSLILAFLNWDTAANLVLCS